MRSDMWQVTVDKFLFSFIKSSTSDSRLEIFVSSFKRLARLKNYFRFELGLGSAWLEVQNLSWARAWNENLNMSQARVWLKLKKLGTVLAVSRVTSHVSH